MKGTDHGDKKQEEVQTLQAVIHSRPEERLPAGILLETRMQEGKQKGQPAQMVEEAGEPPLLLRAFKRRPRSGVEEQAPRILEKNQGCVTRPLKSATCC